MFQIKHESRELVLRPEGTAGVLKAFLSDASLQNSLATNSGRFWYFGPMFRHEHPQKGRLRQFYQIGLENIGYSSPIIDAEGIYLCHSILTRIGLSEEDFDLQINCLGSEGTRKQYSEALFAYFAKERDRLSEISKARLENNHVLRILDSKDSNDAEVNKNAPPISEFWDKESKDYYQEVQNSTASPLFSFGIDGDFFLPKFKAGEGFRLLYRYYF